RPPAAAAAGHPERVLRLGDDRHLPSDPGAPGASSRRRVASARVAAAVGEGLGCGQEPGWSGVVSEPRVVVVGGGLAGLATALACADGGATVTLLETRPRLGGATFSFRREGLRVDNGQHVFLRCCSAYRSFLDRIGGARAT